MRVVSWAAYAYVLMALACVGLVVSGVLVHRWDLAIISLSQVVFWMNLADYRLMRTRTRPLKEPV